MVKDLYSSYKDLPLAIYQIQNKYRDEARPRAGLLRGREFVMKDSYSFDIDDAGLDASYQRHRDAYIRIFDRLGLRLRHRQGDLRRDGRLEVRGVPGRAAVGEDTYVRCTKCDYAANVEAVEVRPPAPVAYDDAPAAHAEQTPDTPTIDTLVAHLNEKYPRDDRPWTAGDTLKNVLVVLKHPDGTREPLAIGLPGDREVDQKRLEGQLEPIEVEPMDEAEFAKHPTLVKGYIGPGVLGEKNASGIRYVVDPRVVEGTRWVTGADVAGSHVLDLVAGRDFTPDGTIEAAEVRDGDPCPNCDGGVLESARGIEMGHIFQLGRKYADALGLQVLDENGKLVTVTMGSYGIGPSRAVAAIAEGTLDELGLAWPRNVAPADVHLVATGKDEAIFAAADRIAVELSAAGRRRALRRPAQGQPGGEVQGRRADRRPDDRRGRPQPRRGDRRGPRPAYRRARGDPHRPRGQPPRPPGPRLTPSRRKEASIRAESARDNLGEVGLSRERSRRETTPARPLSTYDGWSVSRP